MKPTQLQNKKKRNVNYSKKNYPPAILEESGKFFLNFLVLVKEHPKEES